MCLHMYKRGIYLVTCCSTLKSYVYKPLKFRPLLFTVTIDLNLSLPHFSILSVKLSRNSTINYLELVNGVME